MSEVKGLGGDATYPENSAILLRAWVADISLPPESGLLLAQSVAVELSEDLKSSADYIDFLIKSNTWVHERLCNAERLVTWWKTRASDGDVLMVAVRQRAERAEAALEEALSLIKDAQQ